MTSALLTRFNEPILTISQPLKVSGVRSDLETHAIQKACVQELDDCVLQLTREFRINYSGCSSSTETYLQIQYRICRLVILNSHRPRHTMFSKSSDSLKIILDLCRHFSALNSRGDSLLSESCPRPVKFGFGLEFILDMFFIACESPDLSLRRSAIELLRQCCRREKFWDSLHAAKIAEWLLLEEEKQRDAQDQEREGEEVANRLVLARSDLAFNSETSCSKSNLLHNLMLKYWFLLVS
jgi:hypothetical protein